MRIIILSKIMKIKIGDRVRFLNDTGHGTIVKLLSGNMVEVRTPDGWDIPYRTQDLIVIPDDDGDAYRPEPEAEKEEVKHQDKPVLKEEGQDIFILAVRKSDKGEFAGLDLHLVNDSSQELYFVYYHVGIEDSRIRERETLESGTKIFLEELSLEDLSRLYGWQVQGIMYNSNQNFISPVINVFIPFQTRKFASGGAYGSNDYLHEPAMMIPLVKDDASLMEEALDSEDLRKVIEEKEKDNKVLNQARTFKPGNDDRPQKEVDLHINQLTDHFVGLSNREILGIQMDCFHKELTGAIESNASSIIFIHGIGNGTLKTELRKSVERDYKICSHEDASFREFGFGATLVRIRQNK